MKELFKKIAFFTTKKREGSDTLSDFFKGGDTREKREVIEEAIEKANRDQRELIEKYEKKFSSA